MRQTSDEMRPGAVFRRGWAEEETLPIVVTIKTNLRHISAIFNALLTLEGIAMFTLDSLYTLLDTVCEKQYIFGEGQRGEKELHEYLFTRMQESHGDYDVRKEFIINNNLYNKGKKKERIDIILRTPEGLLPIELKYQHKTDSTARRNASYYFLEDICSVEHYLSSQNEFGHIGYAILMTDDSGYWEKDNYGTAAREFNLRNGRVISDRLTWYDGTGEPHKKLTPLSFRGSYKIMWRCGLCKRYLQDIQNCNCNNFRFRYTVVKVDKNAFRADQR